MQPTFADNGIDDEGVCALAEALRTNTTLTTLGLGGWAATTKKGTHQRGWNQKHEQPSRKHDGRRGQTRTSRCAARKHRNHRALSAAGRACSHSVASARCAKAQTAGGQTFLHSTPAHLCRRAPPNPARYDRCPDTIALHDISAIVGSVVPRRADRAALGRRLLRAVTSTLCLTCLFLIWGTSG